METRVGVGKAAWKVGGNQGWMCTVFDSGCKHATITLRVHEEEGCPQMMALSSLLLQRGAVTLAEVETALARQSVYGGDIVTNLLEVAVVQEAKLLEAVAECEGLRACSPGPLVSPGSEVLGIVPLDLAKKASFFPLSSTGETLTVAVAERMPFLVQQELGFSLGLKVDQVVSLRPRILQSLARDYGLPLDRRCERVLARLEEREDPFPSELPPPPLQSILPSRLSRGPTPGSSQSIPSESGNRGRASNRPTSRLTSRPRKGPFELLAAQEQLDQAEQNAEVSRILFDFAKQFFEYTALFIVRDDLAEGMEAAGPGASVDRIRAIGVPLEMPSILSKARDEKNHVLSVPTQQGIDAILRQDLQRPMNARVLAIPVAVRGRVVAILLGDDGTVDVDLTMVGDVLALVPLVGASFERLILRRKLEEKAAKSAQGTLPRGRKRRDTLRGLPAVGRVQSSEAAAPVVVPTPEVPERRLITSPFVQAVPLGSFQKAASSSDNAISHRSEDEQEKGASTSEVELPVSGIETREQGKERKKENKEEELPELSVGEAEEDDDMVKEVLAQLQRSPVPGEVQSDEQESSTTVTVLEAMEPPKSQSPSDMGLPLVILNVGNEIEDLLERLESEDTTEQEVDSIRRELNSFGEAGFDPAFQRYVELIDGLFDGDGDVYEVASKPLVRFLAEQGGGVVGTLSSRFSESDPRVRLGALLLLAEIGGKEARKTVIAGAFDPDDHVRRATKQIIRVVVGKRAWANGVRSQLRRIVMDESDSRRRLMAIEAMGEVQEGPSVSVLISVMREESSEFRRAAWRGLQYLTRCSHGEDPESWEAWWKDNSHRARYDWLVDALEGEDERQRDAAHLELKGIVGKELGFDPAASREKREHAIEAYRKWFEQSGRKKKGKRGRK